MNITLTIRTSRSLSMRKFERKSQSILVRETSTQRAKIKKESLLMNKPYSTYAILMGNSNIYGEKAMMWKNMTINKKKIEESVKAKWS